MEDQRHQPGTPRRYEDTTHPRNPPNSVVNAPARRAVVWSYFVPIVVLFVIVGAALLYWSNRPSPEPADQRNQQSAVGTVGSGALSTQGGSDPAPRPRSTSAELEDRGADLTPLTSVGGLADANPRRIAGRRVELKDVDVESAQGNFFWVRDGSAKVAVIASADAPQVRAESRVNVSGKAEPDGSGGVRIRADRVEMKK